MTNPRADKKLLVIDPAVQSAEDQSVAEVLQDWPGTSEVLRPALDAADLERLTAARDFDGVVVLGSHVSVHDEHPWIERLGNWMQPILDGECPVPLLAICFAHQLIAERAGGHVDFLRDDRTMKTTVEDSDIARSSLLPGEHSLRVLVIQRWEVKTAPPGYRVTARRPEGRVDGLEHESLPIYSFQFHPDGREQLAQGCDIDPALVDERLRADGQRILGAFRRRVLAD